MTGTGTQTQTQKQTWTTGVTTIALLVLCTGELIKITRSSNVRSYLRTCAPSEDSNKPAHPHSVICMKGVSLVIQNVYSEDSDDIRKTCLYDFDPLKAYFYIVKLGFKGVYIIFLTSAQKQTLTKI